jgi:hypothetical protein
VDAQRNYEWVPGSDHEPPGRGGSEGRELEAHWNANRGPHPVQRQVANHGRVEAGTWLLLPVVEGHGAHVAILERTERKRREPSCLTLGRRDFGAELEPLERTPSGVRGPAVTVAALELDETEIDAKVAARALGIFVVDLEATGCRG